MRYFEIRHSRTNELLRYWIWADWGPEVAWDADRRIYGRWFQPDGADDGTSAYDIQGLQDAYGTMATEVVSVDLLVDLGL